MNGAALTAGLCPTGSRWYAQGHHWLVVAQGVRDGEPAVRIRCLTKNVPPRHRHATVIARLFERHADRVEEDR